MTDVPSFEQQPELAAAAPVVTRLPTIDPLVTLAVNMLVAPGTFAILAGSGMSSAAGIMTGDQVMRDLIRTVAQAEEIDVNQKEWDPKGWWTSTRGSEPAYDRILGELAPTDAMRQHLLGSYFEKAEPTEAHRAMARLCARGLVKVILTTNFDRLIEQALEAKGVKYQVASDEHMIGGLTPLVHAPVTVLKLHGDYQQGRMLNTTEELSKYSTKLRTYLARVLEDFGVLSVGWSADYDTAVASLLASKRSRRYPFFLGAHLNRTSQAARNLVTSRGGTVVPLQGADQLFRDLEERMERLEAEVAVRRRPKRRRLGMGIIHYQDTQRPDGWATLPLLRLEVAAIVSGAGDYDLIRAGDREALLAALNNSIVRHHLAGAAMADSHIVKRSPVQATLGNAGRTVQPIPDLWGPTPGLGNNSDQANYRLGGDASNGVSALAMAQMPALSGQRTSAKFILEMGLTLSKRLELTQAALLLRDGLLLVTAELPAALSRVLADARLTAAEFLIRAKATPQQVGDESPAQLETRIELASFGERPARTPVTRYVYGLELDGHAPTTVEAGEAVADALELLAYDMGYEDPRPSISTLRQQLGLAAET